MKATIIAAALIAIASSAYAQNPTTREGWLDSFRQAEATAKCRAATPITVGMTAAALEQSCWGVPDHRDTTKTAAGVSHVWQYQWKGGHRVAYLRNGVVVAVREIR